ncbi:hypothetical protein PoB_004625300 [Plakobranchus ocellatus]|uniref:Uncharacterized protein n=1 Tax=Plakobranchus ocellatus TaxID=259542 RepID=A0AAV4BJH0_9GAST|nr:hypothetical protein PoB_004625300 [Plakobranchus ocellatus]
MEYRTNRFPFDTSLTQFTVFHHQILDKLNKPRRTTKLCRKRVALSANGKRVGKEGSAQQIKADGRARPSLRDSPGSAILVRTKQNPTNLTQSAMISASLQSRIWVIK